MGRLIPAGTGFAHHAERRRTREQELADQLRELEESQKAEAALAALSEAGDDEAEPIAEPIAEAIAEPTAEPTTEPEANGESEATTEPTADTAAETATGDDEKLTRSEERRGGEEGRYRWSPYH